MKCDFVLNNEELKVRKRWLLVFLCKIIFSLLFVGIATNFLVDIDSVDIVMLQMLLVHFFLIYFFAYLRFGTQYLSLILVVTLMSSVGTIREVFEGLQSVIIQPELFPFWVLNVLDITLGVVFCIYSFKIWHINKALKLSKKFPDEVKAIVSLLKGASSLEDLRAIFCNEVRERPQLERIIAREYQIMKSSMENMKFEQL